MTGLPVQLFPAIEPFQVHRLKVSDLHELYVEECGNPRGRPIVFLHGGPGGGIEPSHRRFFDPEHYRIILFDQRGCGKSHPHAELIGNTTWDLVEDIEKIRTHLKIDQWTVFGGSWGSTLALAYASKHPESVLGLILRGIFLCRPQEIHWFYQSGAHNLYPDAWEEYLKPIPPSDRDDLVKAYYQRLTHEDPQVRLQAAIAWSQWEARCSKLLPDSKSVDHFGKNEPALAFARIECHYFIHNSFLESDNYLIEQLPRYRHIPAVIIHGRHDTVCPLISAWELHRAWPEAEFQIIEDAGHSAFEPGIARALIEATQKFRSL